MSKEAKFHKLIESQDIEEKERAWETLQAKLAEETEVPLPQPKKRKLSWVKLTSVFASIILIVMVGVYTAIKLQPDKTRYCSSSEYQTVAYDKNLKEYSLETGEEVLFLNWYDAGAMYMNNAISLLENDEVIAITEEIEDINTGSFIKLYVIKKNFVLEDYQLNKTDSQKSNINNIEIFWSYIDYLETALADFTYGDYQYYIKVEYPFGEQYILDIVEEMLPN